MNNEKRLSKIQNQFLNYATNQRVKNNFLNAMDVCSSYLHKMYNASSPLQYPEKENTNPKLVATSTRQKKKKKTSVNRELKPTETLL